MTDKGLAIGNECDLHVDNIKHIHLTLHHTVTASSAVCTPRAKCTDTHHHSRSKQVLFTNVHIYSRLQSECDTQSLHEVDILASHCSCVIVGLQTIPTCWTFPSSLQRLSKLPMSTSELIKIVTQIIQILYTEPFHVMYPYLHFADSLPQAIVLPDVVATCRSPSICKYQVCVFTDHIMTHSSSTGLSSSPGTPQFSAAHALVSSPGDAV